MLKTVNNLIDTIAGGPVGSPAIGVLCEKYELELYLLHCGVLAIVHANNVAA